MAAPFDLALEALGWIGTAAFATAGALAAARKRMDPVGFLLVAGVTAFGGGALRDLMLGLPVAWLTRPDLAILAAVFALLVFFVAPRIERRVALLLWADAAGMAVFAVLGAETASRAGAAAWVAVLMGVMTASFGGLIRDVICGEIPLILRREIYATAAAAGAGAFLALERLGAARTIAVAAGVLVAFITRAAALGGGWSLPAYGGQAARGAADPEPDADRNAEATNRISPGP
ncbi:trimeric intracellular cation channel family protein [Roseomonas sp. SSH11]|uniref:Trimeric intracellular cation channel family protein n=1 Tax=Pararoseomonas baculiformis TaxID=2820812 RepID=A0ABS4AAU4_9PROT|nr:trimeric intracellular cation channel family protein [Pararoseomonas baculiformis]MBP0444118.1 trimeric intracellular cation channel family protein [Pararoseomonas baculiformis]